MCLRIALLFLLLLGPRAMAEGLPFYVGSMTDQTTSYCARPVA